MGYLQVQDPVEVIARFSSQGIIRPLVFFWAGRQYQVQETTYRWCAVKGRATLRFFSIVTSTEDAYQLCYREEDSTWWLESVWTPG
jgi:hypothetical protein